MASANGEAPAKTWADQYEALAGFRSKTRAQLIALIEAMAADWHTLNYIHNQRAEGNSWCEEYEERQDLHNTRFAVLKLMGRRDKRLIGTRPAGL